MDKRTTEFESIEMYVVYFIRQYELKAESKTCLHAQTENESVAISASTVPDTAARIWQDDPFYCTVPQNDSNSAADGLLLVKVNIS